MTGPEPLTTEEPLTTGEPADGGPAPDGSPPAAEAARHPAQRAFAAPFSLLVGFYRRFISPLKPPMCRFEPSCSAYAEEALRVHLLPRALLLTIWRLLRCQPFCRGGYDPVPPRRRPPSQEAP